MYVIYIYVKVYNFKKKSGFILKPLTTVVSFVVYYEFNWSLQTDESLTHYLDA